MILMVQCCHASVVESILQKERFKFSCGFVHGVQLLYLGFLWKL